MKQITLTKPDDWHLHLRDGDSLITTVQHTARTFGRAIVMPNLNPVISSAMAATDYRERILAAATGTSFTPLMTLYLTDSLSTKEITKAHNTGHVYAAKYYPAGATTNSEDGVTNIENIYPLLEKMSELGIPLLVHGEVTDADVDIFDREKVFIHKILQPLAQRFPGLKIVLEHITTKDAVDFVLSTDQQIAATITAHHLLYNRNHMLVGRIRPHLYCFPILKRNIHQQALIVAATSGNKKFFLGTDSAPHGQQLKESHCGCAGVYTAHGAIELYAEAFDAADALDKLEGFASFNGADFYDLPRNKEKLILQQQSWTVPHTYPMASDKLVPLRAGETIKWTVVGE